MPLITVLLVLIVAGVLLWLMNTYIPMDPNFKKLANIVAIIAAVLWLLQVFGLFDLMRGIRVGH